MYFLNQSHNIDMKRTKNFFKLLKENPFKFHKKKLYDLSNDNNAKNSDNNTINSELLFCQRENDKIIKSFHNFMKSKSQILDKNKKNYLSFLEKEKERKNKKSILNYKNKTNFYSLKLTENQFNTINNCSFSPKYIKNSGSDITNPNYFDNIAKKLIMRKNIDIMNYNIQAHKLKVHPNYKKINNFCLKKNIPLSPGKINNPRYYFLGESKLTRNPIVNPGNRCISPNYINYNRKKSEICLS